MIHRVALAAFVSGWLALIGSGSWLLMRYDFTPGAAATVPNTWPATAPVQGMVSRDATRPTLLLFAHGRCPCTRASLGELGALMASCGDRMAAHVLLYRPSVGPWPDDGLAKRAAAIPGVDVVHDVDGQQARAFGAITSGHAMLFAPDGTLLFEGGITAARGQRGDSVGHSAILALVTEPSAANAKASAARAPPPTPVFGCGLVADPHRQGA